MRKPFNIQILTWKSVCPDDWTMRLAMDARKSSLRGKVPRAMPWALAPFLLDIWIREDLDLALCYLEINGSKADK